MQYCRSRMKIRSSKTLLRTCIRLYSAYPVPHITRFPNVDRDNPPRWSCGPLKSKPILHRPPFGGDEHDGSCDLENAVMIAVQEKCDRKIVK
jgi:hypothetical protein